MIFPVKFGEGEHGVVSETEKVSLYHMVLRRGDYMFRLASEDGESWTGARIQITHEGEGEIGDGKIVHLRFVEGIMVDV